MNLLVKARTKLRRVLVFIWRLQVWLSFHTAGTHAYYYFCFVYLSLFGVLVFDCYLLNIFLSSSKGMFSEGACSSCVPPPCRPGDRSLRRAAGSPGTGCCSQHGDEGPTLLGLTASPSVVLFSPNGPESFLLAVTASRKGREDLLCHCAVHRSCSIHELPSGAFSGDLHCPKMDFPNVESCFQHCVKTWKYSLSLVCWHYKAIVY